MAIRINISKIEEYRELFDAMPLHVFWKDSNHMYLGANKKYIKVNNFEDMEFIGKTDYELFEKDFADQFIKGDYRALAGEVYEDRPEPNLNNLDGHRIFKAVKVPLYDDFDHIVGVLGFVQDLSVEESEAINALNMGYYKLQKDILDTMISSVVVIDPKDYTVLFANKHAPELFEIDEKEIVGRKCYSALAGLDKPCENCKLFDPKARESYVEMHLESNERIVKLHVNSSKWQGKDALIRFDEDITKIKKDAEEMSKVRQESEMKNKFLANMSHDLRTPLNAVLGLAELGLKSESISDKDDALNKILSSGKYLTRILNDILDMTKITAGEVKLVYSDVDIKAFENEMFALITSAAKEKGVEVTFNCSRDYEILNFDKSHVMQIVINLLNNAVKYNKEGGKVELTTTYSKDEFQRIYAEITVSDDGIGISKEFMEKMYLPFERSKRIENANIEGTGLGLSIISLLVELMNGTIKCESELDKGTVFTVNIPVSLPKGDVTKNKIKRQRDIKKVLIAEDVEINAYIITNILKHYGIESETVNNGLKAVEKIEDSRESVFDLILMDIKMPVMDGLTATRKIREMGSNIPIIGFSANAFEEDIRISKNAGMNDHLAKPIDVELLLEKLNEI